MSTETMTQTASPITPMTTIQRDPKSSMKSTWRTDPNRTSWRLAHYLVEYLGLHPTDNSKPIPVHDKNDKMPYLPHVEGHRWILLHAIWPILIQQAYISLTGRNFSPIFAFVFYNIAFTFNAARELHMLRGLGHKYGFLDGDKHARDQIPDHSVSKVFISLICTAAFRPMMSVFFAFRTTQPPSSISWWLPVEIGLYGIVLDFWFYWYHRCMHEYDGLWKFHRTHHMTKHPNPLLTLYADTEQEIFDIAVVPLLTYATLKLVGLPMGFYEWWFCHQYVVFAELFGHSGIRIWATPTSTNNWFLAWFGAELNIEDHDLHHRQGWKKSMNYGKQTLLWDVVFNTKGKRIEVKDENVDFTEQVKLPWF